MNVIEPHPLNQPVWPETYIASVQWTFAKTMPENPHEYTVRPTNRDPSLAPEVDEEFERMVVYIREHGYRDSYVSKGKEGQRDRRYWYTYLNVGEWRYWTMGAPIPSTIIINRARLADVVKEPVPLGAQ
jgi:hypothetical protein